MQSRLILSSFIFPRTLVLARHNHRQHGWLYCSSLAVSLPRLRDPLLTHNVCQGSVFQNLRCCIADIEKDLIQSAMFGIAINQNAKLISVPEGRECTVNQTNDFGEMYF